MGEREFPSLSTMSATLCLHVPRMQELGTKVKHSKTSLRARAKEFTNKFIIMQTL